MDERRTVVVGVTGGIAAYKACLLVRGLQKAGLRVRVVMTQAAAQLVGPATFEALTHEPVPLGLFGGSDPIPHITLAKEADLFIVAPCTMNVAAKIACGIADDLLTSAVLACTCPVLLAPAANEHMYQAAVSVRNRELLAERGFHLIEADPGYLACGDEGPGRMAEPDEIVARALTLLGVKGDMRGVRLLITAGPTIEPIDPVRYITNFSSGKTGYSLAAAAAARGAEVTIVSGPVAADAPPHVRIVPVRTAQEMMDACEREFPECDIAVFAAAVADLRPEVQADRKLKKGLDDEALQTIRLARNPDILATCGERKEHQVVVGFAAETDDVVSNARKKLAAKHADLIIANEVGPEKAFGTEGNEITFVTQEGEEHLPYMLKTELADIVLDRILALRGKGA